MRIIGVLACDLAGGGLFLGDESMWRCVRVVKEAQSPTQQSSTRIVAAAGLSPNREKFPWQKKSMAELMRIYLSGWGWPEELTLVPALGWGTMSELKIIRDCARAQEAEEVVLVTSWYHIPRTRLLWKRLQGPNARFVSAKGKLVNALWEFLKFPKALLLDR